MDVDRCGGTAVAIAVATAAAGGGGALYFVTAFETVIRPPLVELVSVRTIARRRPGLGPRPGRSFDHSQWLMWMCH